MQVECGGEVVARFRLNMRCHNCRLKAAHVVDVPAMDDAPTDVDDLLASAFLAGLKFRCERCENAIGTLLSVSPLPLN